jgi:hypothetical protein
MLTGTITGLAWFVLFFLGHAAASRLAAPSAAARANQFIFLAGLIGIPVSLGLMAANAQAPVLTLEGFAFATLCGALLYGGLFVLYMPFYYVVMASLSVRTVVLLGREPDGALPLRALQDKFASRQLVGQRLHTMVENRFLRATPLGYVLTAKGEWTAQFFDFLKRLWRLGAGG